MSSQSSQHTQSSQHAEAPKPTSPARPKHQLSRSISELSTHSFSKIHRQHHHLYRKDDKFPQLTNQYSHPNVVLEESKSGGMTPVESHPTSRRTSILADVEMNAFARERSLVKESDVAEEKEKGVFRATELRNALVGLNTLSNNTTRRLDNSYYAVLEKLSSLQGTIASLKELARMTRDLNENFKSETEEVVKDAEAHLNEFRGFEEQKVRIEALQGRVEVGREQIKILDERVGVTRERVEGWERAEMEWKDKLRKRMRVIWILTSFCAAVVLALAAFQYTPARNLGVDAARGLNSTNIIAETPNFDRIKNEAGVLGKSIFDALEDIRQKEQEPLEDDPRLRVFDEL